MLGASGQLGRSFCRMLPDSVGLTRKDLDVNNLGALEGSLVPLQPTLIINCSAYTQVDQAEFDRDHCFLSNTLAVEALGVWCAKNQVPLVHFSTDYVFDGQKQTPYLESDPTCPVNYYGETKRDGENRLRAIPGLMGVIVRTSWVYAEFGKNFFRTMVRLLSERTQVSVVSDQFGAPTYAPDLARLSLEVLQKGCLTSPPELLNITNAGDTSWFEFAQAIREELQKNRPTSRFGGVRAISTAEYPTKAKRPIFSILSLGRLTREYAIEAPHWRIALSQCVEQYYALETGSETL